MSARALHRASQVGILVSAAVILYITLAPEPPHWGTFVPAPPAPEGAPAVQPRSLAPPPGWTSVEEEAVGHSLVFFALGIATSLWYATSAAARRSPQRTLLRTMLALWLFAGISEALQAYTPTRSPQLSDLGFDLLGALLGFFGGGLVWRLVLTRSARATPAAREARPPRSR